VARVARVVVPGVPHHVTQRGNRRQLTFFDDGDYSAYKSLAAEFCSLCGVDIIAYCLMPNHVHLVAVPRRAEGLRKALAETHRRYTLRINERNGWTGYLWQGRFNSCPMDERHLVAAVRYVERNPVRAGLARHAWNWPWSSAKAHVSGQDDLLAKPTPLLEGIRDWVEFLRGNDTDVEALRKHSRTGRPLGDKRFVEKCAGITGTDLTLGKPGRKRGTRY
jgi:putative transposase